MTNRPRAVPRSVSPRPSPSPARDTLRTVARLRTRTLTRSATSWSRRPSSRKKKNRPRESLGSPRRIDLPPHVRFFFFLPCSECVFVPLPGCVCTRHHPSPYLSHSPSPPPPSPFASKRSSSLFDSTANFKGLGRLFEPAHLSCPVFCVSVSPSWTLSLSLPLSCPPQLPLSVTLLLICDFPHPEIATRGRSLDNIRSLCPLAMT